MRTPSPRSRLARLGYREPSRAEACLAELPEALHGLVEECAQTADPDAALQMLVRFSRAEIDLSDALADDEGRASLLRVLGGSLGIAEHLERHAEDLDVVLRPHTPKTAEEYRSSLLESVAAEAGASTLPQTHAVGAMRDRYRRHVAELVAWDLALEDPKARVDTVSAALADLASAALEAGIAIARAAARERFGADADRVRLAVIGMGKTGARELNYVSDVDVIWVHGVDDSSVGHSGVDEASALDDARATQIATLLARETTAACSQFQAAPPLWEVDANLRPEGKDGPLTRTLASHIAYYERWAKSWEFQALLKARPIAGDADLGAAYDAAVRAKVWESSGREGFVDSVQRMRERVTEHIPADEVDRQLKLGPGGLRDIEFTVQLLQLVHGADDPSLRQRGTLEALDALAARGIVGRTDRDEFSDHYRFLRVLEHRIQFWRMRRTHLMPLEEDALRRLARTARVGTAAELTKQWQAVRRAVRTLHERIFYRPLLGAVASLDRDDVHLTPEAAQRRLLASGYIDPKGALAHIGELTEGVSRRAQIQRLLLPVLLGWFAEGADPDMGLLAFRRLSEALGDSPWFLRMLRDSPVAARRLTSLLSSSRLIGSLMERLPEAAWWLDGDEQLRPRSEEALREETAAILARHGDDTEAVQRALRGLRRREHLRVATASALQRIDETAVGVALTAIAAALVDAAVTLHTPATLELAIITMGRTGGREIGFGSDIDVMHVARGGEDPVAVATVVVRKVQETLADPSLPFELDAGLRPEGRQGPLVRTLESYRTYYDRWSEPWEAQALLRARPFAGDAQLAAELMAVIDERRYPAEFPSSSVREVRRIKARVEAERLPRAADRSRHLKLGDGALSDIEWLVQLLQLRHAGRIQSLRTPSTLEALAAAARADLIDERDAAVLREAWLLATRIRNALALARARSIDVLPEDRAELEAIARLVGLPAGSAAALEEQYLATTRRARRVFDLRFYED
ncbi:bifunctional [glutamine synthetase] adenylyltransferase/[glutamine synthetase]-adenylyl-L-tyrosine phosphorylase [Agrococcus sp. ARC_14]|uniref:bifunctional [glutamine synthetase] adenylyltransferase/[glutamine synthetase]-adenylyl-L-tyrosine phosphorylase n=1 Tax=Agrococcus sp. ARC_14 TaxID=2919927 RepID=UPI001F067CEF|nr:bifunctional [glutamine synthetase] adenylyltransferase/[glutamine synthetase]-adenylyl-L-tyrosine phosphorylase [Agrococcus sp. ARC_14]MCH1882996.1 bifunctional [glutamine synthetase] adenylyltransferase/[glutamine synthetase]-adenylyl-L-tyrosine phosphorylase [Agrococcus sp. ARC_14]